MAPLRRRKPRHREGLRALPESQNCPVAAPGLVAQGTNVSPTFVMAATGDSKK